MNSIDFVIYVGQCFFFLCIFSIVFYFCHWRKVSIVQYVCLFISTILLAAISARLGYSSIESDTKDYLKDAILLHRYIREDSSRWSILLLTGGNSLYPKSFYPMLFASNTWANYSSFTMEKLFLIFSYFSKPNLFNISLFFGLLSFISKILLLKVTEKVSIQSIEWVYWLLVLGGFDLYFVNGLYKENILFFCFSYLLYFYYSRKTKIQWVFALFIYMHILFLRFEIGILLSLVFILFSFYTLERSSKRKLGLIYLLVSFVILASLLLTPFGGHIANRIERYQNFSAGNLGLENILNKNLAIEFIPYILKGFFRVFYQPVYSKGDWYFLLDVWNLTLVGVILFLIRKAEVVERLIFPYLFISFVIIMVVIGSLVPNFGTQIRYRAPFMLFFLLGLLLSNKNIKKIYM